MKLTTPRWWYVRDRAPAPMTRALLRPLGWLWAEATERRNTKTKPYDSGIPVISVGNLTVGGSGKTPVAREVLRLLRDRGINAHGLSRGYGGKLKGPHRVDPARDTFVEVGDEPMMLAMDGPFWISRDRPAGARAAVADGAEVVVLDDGHQNPTLKKTLSLVVVDGETRNNEWPFGDGAVFPSGPMRELLAVGLARADAVIVLLPDDMPEADPELLAVFEEKPVLIARLKPKSPPPSGPQVGFAGIAKPWKVERSLEAAGCKLVDFIPYADHQAYDDATLRFLDKRAHSYGAGLVTTEKDWVRLTPAWRARVKPWPVRARFEDEKALVAVLRQAATSG